MEALQMQSQMDSITPTATKTKGSRAKRKRQEITITYVNELQPGILEKALVNIYVKKIKNGTLNIS